MRGACRCRSTADDFRLRHKTTDRGFYDDARTAPARSRSLSLGPTGFLDRRQLHQPFVERDGQLLTPAAALGLLPGMLRGALIEQGGAVEGDLTARRPGGRFFIGNALRGLIRHGQCCGLRSGSGRAVYSARRFFTSAHEKFTDR